MAPPMAPPEDPPQPEGYKEVELCTVCSGAFPIGDLIEFHGQLYCALCKAREIKEQKRQAELQSKGIDNLVGDGIGVGDTGYAPPHEDAPPFDPYGGGEDEGGGPDYPNPYASREPVRPGGGPEPGSGRQVVSTLPPTGSGSGAYIIAAVLIVLLVIVKRRAGTRKQKAAPDVL